LRHEPVARGDATFGEILPGERRNRSRGALEGFTSLLGRNDDLLELDLRGIGLTDVAAGSGFTGSSLRRRETAAEQYETGSERIARGVVHFHRPPSRENRICS
jgi:hypothetical protein